MEEDAVTIPQFQSYRSPTTGSWCHHESVKSLISVPLGAREQAPFGSRERTRPGSNGRATVHRINQVLALQPGWDGCHARIATIEALSAVIEVLNAIDLEHVPVPDVSPSIDGGLLLEWHRNGFELDVWVGPDGSVNVTYDRAEASWEASWDECGIGVPELLLDLAEPVPELVG